MYTSKTTRRNVGVSYNSQDEADLQAAQMDENDCFNCVNCTDCTGCRDCRNCVNCVGHFIGRRTPRSSIIG